MPKVKALSVLSILVVSLILATSVSLAQETSSSTTSSASTTNPHPMPLVVQIGPAGNALIRGTVTNVGTDSLSVKSWGGGWTIKIDSNTKFLPQGLTLDQIKAGDLVGLNGKVNSEEILTVHATLIRDWTEKKIIKEEVKQNIKEVREIKKETTPRINTLTVGSIDQTNNSITATMNGQTITVKINNAKLIDRNWRSITLDKIQTNDTIRVYGILSGNTLDASVIRDISVPRK
jgi:hypothetical protein